MAALGATDKSTVAELIRRLVHGYQPFSEDDVIFALHTGRILWELIPNITPVTLLLLRLPMVDSERTDSYIEAGRKALEAFKVGQDWYSYTEHAGPSPLDWEFYNAMSVLLVAAASE